MINQNRECTDIWLFYCFYNRFQISRYFLLSIHLRMYFLVGWWGGSIQICIFSMTPGQRSRYACTFLIFSVAFWIVSMWRLMIERWGRCRQYISFCLSTSSSFFFFLARIQVSKKLPLLLFSSLFFFFLFFVLPPG